MSRKRDLVTRLQSGKWQLNMVGAVLILLLLFSAWLICRQPISAQTIVPLTLIAYAAGRIVYELTINRHRVPTLATSTAGRKRIAALIAADVKTRALPVYTAIDLGSGRGELAQRIARTAKTAKVIGIEYASIPHWQSRMICSVIGPSNLSFEKLDFWTYDCANADAIFLYLNQRLAQRAGEKLATELKPGSLVISHNFQLLGSWTPVERIEFRTPFKEVLFVYRKV